MKHLLIETDLGREVGPLLLTEGDRHRLRRVLRMRPGDKVVACDGLGQRVACVWNGAALEPRSAVEQAPRNQPIIELGVGLLKGPRWEWLIEKCVEVGVDRIVPLLMDHCVARAPTKADRLARWQGVARSATEQSGRYWATEVRAPAQLSDWLAQSESPVLYGDERLRQPTIGEWYRRSERADVIRLLVGPEGGLSEAERQSLHCTAASGIALAPWVLRAETAAVAAVFALRDAGDWLSAR